ncbi:MAG: O-methyltransferase [Candidatus Fonsibacter ubiquis]|uniref:O-methyltransferase n=1 Tax=Candidatus Fonsibacter ubiquis TaxID=1925548 RepID=UPI000C085E56|nr:class I SAM-dependent methyltransferase [Candidatus Fonsibacter ubiquis]NDB38334.1 methyltransferase domain-containing protein [Pseudomonadota bacterium]GBL33921.1 putative caffeoyl-CoA O-methyltransferase At1g67980 [Pelagibacterales bacterium]NCU45039.1 methyltransferase domain-containing protein [Candidatus Fonsibacter ubiquis]NCU46085.1 methyltransferase domain-containing protein [Candidatus Fonsibacter ubiquis]NCU47751.1 methyltransferase domain-containing protein [Candidatus Fonsibacte
MFKSIENSAELQKYIFTYGVNEHPLQKEIREYTEKNLGNSAIMQISPDQGALLQFIIKSSNIQNCLEIGTFTGYSALTMALALPENGSIVSLDIDKVNTDIAKKYWSKHSVGKKIDFILAPALETMEEFINQDKMFDLIFIDADKKNYKNYFLKSLELLEKDGIIIIDNTLWKGKVFDLNITDDQTNSIREFNSFVRDFKGTDSMILPIADGMTICRKL